MKRNSEQIVDNRNNLLECKQCHHLIDAEETMAYHLVDRILYGWCESCFAAREKINAIERAA